MENLYRSEGGNRMSKCDNCLIRQAYALGFGMHWMGEDDCPAECPVDLEYGETYNSPTYRLEQNGSPISYN